MLSQPTPQPEVGANTMHSNLCVCCCNICNCLLQVFPPLGCVSLPDLSLYPNQPPSQKWAQILCTQICVFNCTCLSTSIPTPRVCQSAWLVMLSQPAPRPEVGAVAMHSNLEVSHSFPLVSRLPYGRRKPAQLSVGKGKGKICNIQKWTLCEFICLFVLSFGSCLLVCQLDLLPSSTVLVCQQVFPVCLVF